MLIPEEIKKQIIMVAITIRLTNLNIALEKKRPFYFIIFSLHKVWSISLSELDPPFIAPTLRVIFEPLLMFLLLLSTKSSTLQKQ